MFSVLCQKNGNLMTMIILVGFSCSFRHCLCTLLTFLADKWNQFLN